MLCETVFNLLSVTAQETESDSVSCAVTLSEHAPTFLQIVSFTIHRHRLHAACRACFLYPSFSKSSLEVLAKFISESHTFSKDATGAFADQWLIFILSVALLLLYF